MDILKQVESLIISNDLNGLRKISIDQLMKIGKQVPLPSEVAASLPKDRAAPNFIPWDKLRLKDGETVSAARVCADGNCLYNACSLAVSGGEEMSCVLRALTSAELYLHPDFYASHPHFVTLLAKEKSDSLLETFFSHSITHEASDLLSNSCSSYADCVKFEALKNCQDKRWSPFICMLALSSVLGLSIHSFYPETGGRRYAINLSNAIILPRDEFFNAKALWLLWSRSGGCKQDLNPSFVPNHIIPLFVIGETSCQSTSEVLPMNVQSFKKQAKILFPKLSSKVHSKEEETLKTLDPDEHQKLDTVDSVSAQQVEANVTKSFVSNDIGFFCSKAAGMSDKDKFDIIHNVWKPDKNFSFPAKLIYGKNRKFNHSWLNDFSWLVYSKILVGAFCLPCILFGKNVGSNASKLDRLVKSPLNDWSCASSKLKEHQQKSEVHKFAVESMQRFLNVMNSQTMSIVQIHGQAMGRAVKQNRLKLGSIAKTVLLCARQNIPLRGHRDDSKHYDSHDCGNFQALLDFRVDSGDTVLGDHFKSAPRIATFRSKTIQNELISSIGDEINNQIIHEIKECGPFSILADEVTDCSNKQQMPLVLRYVDKKGEIQERFIKFISCDTGISGKALQEKIVQCIVNELNLDIMNCRGQCYDGAANMAGKYSGVASRILEINDLALYTHCASHRLNLAVAASCKLQNVKNMMEFIRKIGNFFHTPKRQLLLEEMITKHIAKYKHTKLIDPCKTRWVLRIDALERFVEMYVPILEAIRIMSENKDKTWDDSSSDAYTYSFALKSFEFIMTLVTVKMLLGYTRSATVQLQSSQLDIIEGLKQIDIMKKSLQTARNLIDGYHSVWFKEAQEIAKKVNIPVDSPRICSSQIYRSNTPFSDVESYYRLNIAIPFLDHLLQELSTRFSEKTRIAMKGISIVPGIMKSDYRSRAAAQKRDNVQAFGSTNSLDNPKRRYLGEASSSTDIKYENGASLKASEEVDNNIINFTTMPGSCNNKHKKTPERPKIRIQRKDKIWKQSFEEFCNQYVEDLPDPAMVSHEVDHWESAWIDVPDDQLPKNIFDTLKIVNKSCFPNIHACLKILAVLPVTSCSCERSASAVRLLKTSSQHL